MPMISRRSHIWLALSIPCLVVGCEDRAANVGERFYFEKSNILSPRGREVALNEELWLRFSSPIDPARVTADSFGIFALDEEGRIQRDEEGKEIRAQGELAVDVHRILFRPLRPLSSRLDDGGLLPGTNYYVRVAGFPRVDGLCALDGRPLENSVTFWFRTAARRSKGLFTATLAPGPFQLEGWVSGTSWILQDPNTGWGRDTTKQDDWDGFPLGSPWYFVFSAPVRPDRIDGDALRLTDRADPDRPLLLTRVRLLRARAFQERFPSLVRERRTQTSLPQIEDGVVLEVQPFGLQPYHWYTLEFSRDPERGVRDDAGNVLLGAGDDPYLLPILVRDSGERVTESRGPAYFQVLYMSSTDVVRPEAEVLSPDVDGALVVDQDGGALVPWIREGGRGELEGIRDGETVTAVEHEQLRSDRPGWHFRRLLVASDSTVTLGPGTFHVLRSQGRMDVEGTLRAEPCELHEPRPLPAPNGTIEDVIGHLGAAGEELCVLVSSGDLTIRGTVDLPGRTLVLVSPTRVRLESEARLVCDRLVIVTNRHAVVERPRSSMRIERWFASFTPGVPEELQTELHYVALTRPVRFLPASEKKGLNVSVQARGTRLNVSFQLQRLDATGAVAGRFLDPEEWEGVFDTTPSYRVLMHVKVAPGCGFDPRRAAVLAIEVVGR